MNFEDMLGRLIAGLIVIEGHVAASVEPAAHSYSIMFPQAVRDDFSDSEIEQLQDDGWSWSDDYGWVLPVIG